MRFISYNTSIPVPTVYDAYVQDGNSFIFMSRVQGEPLGQVWDRLGTEQKASIVWQLNHYVAELETLSADFYGALWNLPTEDIFSTTIHSEMRNFRMARIILARSTTPVLSLHLRIPALINR